MAGASGLLFGISTKVAVQVIGPSNWPIAYNSFVALTTSGTLVFLQELNKIKMNKKRKEGLNMLYI
jgi:hypothetical protein